MSVIENSMVIDRPLEQVFDYLSDPRSELQWNPKVEMMEKLTEGPIDVGTKFKAKWSKSKVVTMTCTRYERPRAWSYLNDGPVVVDLSVVLTPHGAGTRLLSRFDAKPRGLFFLVFPMFMLLMRREESKNMRFLKAAVESR